MALEPRLEHNGQIWGLLPADIDRLVAKHLIVLFDGTDPEHPIYELAPDRLMADLDDFLVPLDASTTRVAKRDGAPPIFTGAPHGSGGGGGH